jgi:sugar phosphate isomerase/epimerase
VRIGPRAHLAYCTNVHRGEDWADVRASLEGPVAAVRARFPAARPWALGLRLSGSAVETLLAQPAELAWLRGWLAQHNAYVFTINAFPRGPFHGGRVKEAAYQPDWSHAARVDYTLRVAEVLAALAPRDVAPTLSTVPVGHRSAPPDLAASRANLTRCREGLARLADRTGVRVRIALEPEPMCTLGTAAEAIAFLGEHLATDAASRGWLGVNLDACHHAVEFEDPAAALRAFRSADIPVFKVHLSAALALPPTEAALSRLSSMDEPTYFHQTFLLREKGVERHGDIPEGVAAARADLAAVRELRSHFHVPLHAESLGDGLRSTAPELRSLLDALVADPAACDQLEIETYTWAVLPPALRAATVESQVGAEYDWVLAEFARRGWNPA